MFAFWGWRITIIVKSSYSFFCVKSCHKVIVILQKKSSTKKNNQMKNVMPLLFAFICLMTFIRCQKDVELPLSLNSTSTVLKSSQTFNLSILPDTIGCVYESENNFIASVSRSGLITAYRVGETNIIVKNIKKGFNAKCKVTVMPQYFMFKEPYLMFGATKSAIKSFETRLISLDNATSLVYNGENPYIYLVAYSFENSVYKMNLCFIPNTYASLLGSFVAERYVLVITDVANNSFSMVSPDKKTLVIVKIYSTTYTYVSYSASGLTTQSITSLKTKALF